MNNRKRLGTDEDSIMGGEIGIMCMALQSAEGLIFVVSNHCQTVSPILQQWDL